jgi:aryl-alcohol dehydrogenase-like predicted oxidoreductase
MEDLIPLGKTDIRISPLGLGTWQWGDRMMWGYGKAYTDIDIH